MTKSLDGLAISRKLLPLYNLMCSNFCIGNTKKPTRALGSAQIRLANMPRKDGQPRRREIVMLTTSIQKLLPCSNATSIPVLISRSVKAIANNTWRKLTDGHMFGRRTPARTARRDLLNPRQILSISTLLFPATQIWLRLAQALFLHPTRIRGLLATLP